MSSTDGTQDVPQRLRKRRGRPPDSSANQDTPQWRSQSFSVPEVSKSRYLAHILSTTPEVAHLGIAVIEQAENPEFCTLMEQRILSDERTSFAIIREAIVRNFLAGVRLKTVQGVLLENGTETYNRLRETSAAAGALQRAKQVREKYGADPPRRYGKVLDRGDDEEY